MNGTNPPNSPNPADFPAKDALPRNATVAWKAMMGQVALSSESEGLTNCVLFCEFSLV